MIPSFCLRMIQNINKDTTFFPFSLGITKKAVFTALGWSLVTMLIHFIIPESLLPQQTLLTFGVIFILLPAINHFRMFLAVRRHNSQMVGQLDVQQMSVIFLREKKVAVDMAIVVVILFACLGPMIVIKLAIFSSFPKLYDLLYPWAFTMTYINSSINPFLYLKRNGELRSAVRSVVCSCFWKVLLRMSRMIVTPWSTHCRLVMHVNSYTYYKSVDEILVCDNSNKGYWPEISCGSSLCCTRWF